MERLDCRVRSGAVENMANALKKKKQLFFGFFGSDGFLANRTVKSIQFRSTGLFFYYYY